MNATAKQLRQRARQIGEDLADMTHTALAIADREGWDSPRFAAIEADIAKWREVRAALIAWAWALETAAAAAAVSAAMVAGGAERRREDERNR